MKRYRVRFSEDAEQDVTEIYRYILRHDVFIHCVLDGRRDLPSLLERRLIR